jgi:hypothetical protein
MSLRRSDGDPTSQRRNQVGVGCLEAVVGKAGGFKHDGDLQRLALLASRLGHRVLFRPARMPLRSVDRSRVGPL